MERCPLKEATPLRFDLIPYAYWTEATNPDTGRARPGLGSNRICRFLEPVLLSAMEITRPANIRDGRPDQVTLEVFTGNKWPGRVIFDGRLPWRGDKCRLEFDSIPALAVSQRCHWKSASQSGWSDLHPVPWMVPFTIFDHTHWFGETKPGLIPYPDVPVHPTLELGQVRPRGSSEMKAWADGWYAHFESRHLKVAFALKRPRIHHLSWDAEGTRSLERNFMAEFLPYYMPSIGGPFFRTIIGSPVTSMVWGGKVEVIGNLVRYRDLASVDGLTLDAEFEIEPRGMILRLVQHCARDPGQPG